MNTAKFKQFIQLIDDNLDEDEFASLVEYYESLYRDLPKFGEFLIEECNWDEEELEYLLEDGIEEDDITWAICELLQHFSGIYYDDWKIDYEDLNEYISLCIDSEFFINFDEVSSKHEQSNGELTPADIVTEKLETQSDYTIVALFSGNDDVNLAVVKKADKPKILHLAEELNIWAK